MIREEEIMNHIDYITQEVGSIMTILYDEPQTELNKSINFNVREILGLIAKCKNLYYKASKEDKRLRESDDAA